MADEAVAFHLDAEEQRVVVAVGGGGDDAQAVAAGLALHPELVAGAAPEGDEAGLERLLVAHFVQEAEHQHLAGLRVLHDAGDEAVGLGKVDLWVVRSLVFLSFLLLVLVSSGMLPRGLSSVKRPAGDERCSGPF